MTTGNGASMRFRAFLSYSHSDKSWARWLHRALESYRPPSTLRNENPDLPKRLSPVFRDRDELPSAANLSKAVNAALEQSEKLIVICSPAAAASRWVNEEIRTFRQLRGGQHILCLVIDGEPGSGGANECFPPALLEPDPVSGLVVERVAADARPEGDGRRNALLKLVAGMLGVGFDALKQRELRRRHQRMAVVTTGSLLVAAVTIVLAVYANLARQDAEFRRTQAEDLVGFMLGDLTEQLREIGRLDIYQSIGDEALRYFEAQRDADVSDRTLVQRAQNLRQIGEVRLDQAELDAALIAFNESLLISARLATNDPSNPDAAIGLANSHFYVGHVHWLRGDLAAAREQFREQLGIVQRLSADEPDNTQWLMELGYAWTNLGRILELEGSLEQALNAYENVMAANARLVELEPDNDDWQLELGFAHNNIGKLVVALGRLDEAEMHFARDLDIKTQIFNGHPKHNLWRDYMAVSQYYLGQLLLERGKLDSAHTQLFAAGDNFEFLLQVDPERSNWRWRLANIRREQARHHVRLNDATAAMQSARESIATLDALLEIDDGNTGWRRDRVRSLIVASFAESQLGQTNIALGLLDRARDAIDELLEQEPNVRDTLGLSIQLDVVAASLVVSPDTSAPLIERALQDLDTHFQRSTDPRLLKLRALALSHTGRDAEAEELRLRLAALGVDSLPI